VDDYRADRLAVSYGVSDGTHAATGGGRILVPPIEKAPLPAIDERYLASFFNPPRSRVLPAHGELRPLAIHVGPTRDGVV
jgi:hypothetical protein